MMRSAAPRPSSPSTRRAAQAAAGVLGLVLFAWWLLVAPRGVADGLRNSPAVRPRPPSTVAGRPEGGQLPQPSLLPPLDAHDDLTMAATIADAAAEVHPMTPAAGVPFGDGGGGVLNTHDLAANGALTTALFRNLTAVAAAMAGLPAATVLAPRDDDADAAAKVAPIDLATTVDVQLFVVWPGAMRQHKRILEDIAARFVVLHLAYIDWGRGGADGGASGGKQSSKQAKTVMLENLWRLYSGKGGFQRTAMHTKVAQCGGPGGFVAVVVADPSPRYADEVTAHGADHVNHNMFAAKKRYREWSGGGFKVHGTYTTLEAEHDIRVLLGADPLALAAAALSPRGDGSGQCVAAGGTAAFLEALGSHRRELSAKGQPLGLRSARFAFSTTETFGAAFRSRPLEAIQSAATITPWPSCGAFVYALSAAATTITAPTAIGAALAPVALPLSAAERQQRQAVGLWVADRPSGTTAKASSAQHLFDWRAADRARMAAIANRTKRKLPPAASTRGAARVLAALLASVGSSTGASDSAWVLGPSVCALGQGQDIASPDALFAALPVVALQPTHSEKIPESERREEVLSRYVRLVVAPPPLDQGPAVGRKALAAAVYTLVSAINGVPLRTDVAEPLRRAASAAPPSIGVVDGAVVNASGLATLETYLQQGSAVGSKEAMSALDARVQTGSLDSGAASDAAASSVMVVTRIAASHSSWHVLLVDVSVSAAM